MADGNAKLKQVIASEQPKVSNAVEGSSSQSRLEHGEIITLQERVYALTHGQGPVVCYVRAERASESPRSVSSCV